MSNLLAKAELVESLFHESPESGFSQKAAMLFSVVEGDEGVAITLASENGDVYDLLASDDTAQVAKASDYIAIVTSGWASPIDGSEGEVAPSQHPQRRRVRLLVMASREDMASVMRFEDDPENPILDDGKATGSLADALHFVMVRANA